MKRRQVFASGPADDRGAALLMVLVIVTVIALAGGALLSFSDTSIRTTVALRDQGAGAYAADGAGQVAIEELERGTFPSNCAAPGGSSLSLGNGTAAFYPTQTGATGLNAYVSCAPDTSTGNGVVISSANKPANAILTVGNDAAVVGQDYSSSNKTVNIGNGNVSSNSTINAGSSTLAVSGTGVTVQAALAGGCTGTFSPTPCTPDAGSVPTPSYPAPTDPVSLAPAPVCTTSGPLTYAAFRPGLYTDVNILNAGCGQKDVVWFSPGTYYFDFGGTWNTPTRLVGGTPTDSADRPITGLNQANASTLSRLSQLSSSPGACANPSKQVAPGVTFVFGGDSKIDVGDNALEICATYSATSVPIAIYGPTANIVNGGTVSAEATCKLDSCAMITNSVNGKAELHIQGLTYAPNARVVLTSKSSGVQVFHWGLVLRSFSLENKSSPTNAFVQLPANGTGGATAYSIMHVNVWVCPSSGTACDHSGPPQLRAKVQVTGSPATATVLSWSVQR